MIDLIRGKEILVIGMARSGLAAAELLSAFGAAKITVTDQKSPLELQSELAKLERIEAVTAITGSNPPGLVTDKLSLVVKSPGVPPSNQLFRKAAELGIPVISEIELAYAFLKTPLIGVTGTNGKTTTTALITAILSESGIEPVISAGNIGNPLCGLVGKFSAQGLIVAELSSFQLDRIDQFRPFIGLFLNFAEDHLDYHGSIEAYFNAKARIFDNQTGGDYAILNAGDKVVATLQKKCKAKVIWFDRSPVSCGAGLEDDWITIYNPGCAPRQVCPRAELALPGEHNLENSLAAAAAAWAAGADPESIGRVLRNFKAIEHRLEHVIKIDGVDYINDSKGTNPGATIKALKSFPGRPIILIAGGKDKGADFTDLAAVIKEEVRELVLLGETSDKMAKAVKEAGFENCHKTENLQEAVATARQLAVEGDLVLLSPACASWDMFSDFEERGRLFKDLVRSGSSLNIISGEVKDGS
ncbi:MAG: UDP-N-acetylmuramoyl-L-alanine--D-glutamate ligase [Bacillota bacterium]|nr:UDP-N-acetylmuramoyl-L-alanine--D-glutamate ligase [Bacillota bacterium]